MGSERKGHAAGIVITSTLCVNRRISANQKIPYGADGRLRTVFRAFESAAAFQAGALHFKDCAKTIANSKHRIGKVGLGRRACKAPVLDKSVSNISERESKSSVEKP